MKQAPGLALAGAICVQIQSTCIQTMIAAPPRPYPNPDPEPPRRVLCDGQPCLIVNGRRVWSTQPQPERYERLLPPEQP